MDRDEIISRISYIRARKGLTQKALSYAIEMNPSYINRLESKRDFLPSLEVLLKIIQVCDCTTEEFFYHDIAAYRTDRQLLNTISDLPDGIEDFILNCDPDVMKLLIKLNEKLPK